MTKIFFVLIFFFSGVVIAQASFPENNTYRRDIVNPEKDSFCPRLEGTHPANCCPYREHSPITCVYYNSSTVGVGTNSSGTNCVNGVDTVVSCCDINYVPCIKDLSTKQFIQRLIKRPVGTAKKCEFEACPFPAYWKNSVPAGKEISLINPTLPQCSSLPAQSQCSIGSMPSCSSFSACPLPTPTPTPGPTPGPPSPTPGPTPNPTPGPTPNPTPGPTPNPTPNPGPTPSPPTSGDPGEG